MIQVVLLLISVVLLILAGVGYLGQKKTGRTFGTAYGAIALIGTVIGIVNTGFGGSSVLGLIYPVLTLILVNTTFKNNLVR